MGVKGTLIVSMEVKCEGHLFHDLYRNNPHNLSNISPNKVANFDLREGGIGKVGSVVNWKFTQDGKVKVAKDVIEAIDDEKRSITWKVIGGDLLEQYNNFSVITSCDHHWSTCTFEYEKKSEDTPEPIALLEYVINLTKDIEAHHVKK